MRCPDCNKFATLTFEDPEMDNLECELVDAEAGMVNVSCNVRIVRNCEECGQELKEAQLDLETQVEIPNWDKIMKKLKGEEPELEVEEVSVEQIEEGGGRYAKSFFGAEVNFKIKLDGKDIADGSMSDKVAASQMDELV